MSESAAGFFLEPLFDLPVFAKGLRTAFTREAPPFLSLPDAISIETAAALREALEPLARPFDRPDRGRYRCVDLITRQGETKELTPALAALLVALRDFAESVSGAKPRLGPARALFFAQGDYALRLDDSSDRPRIPLLEATLDLSPEPGDPSVTVYSELPFIHLPVAQQPGQLTLISRSLANTRFDRFRNCVTGERPLILLRAQFPLAKS